MQRHVTLLSVILINCCFLHTWTLFGASHFLWSHIGSNMQHKYNLKTLRISVGHVRGRTQRSNMDLKYQLSELVSMDNLPFDPWKENHPSQRSIFSETLCLLFTQLTNFLEVVFHCVFMLGCTAKKSQTQSRRKWKRVERKDGGKYGLVGPDVKLGGG